MSWNPVLPVSKKSAVSTLELVQKALCESHLLHSGLLSPALGATLSRPHAFFVLHKPASDAFSNTNPTVSCRPEEHIIPSRLT